MIMNIPGFRLAVAIASLAGMTFELFKRSYEGVRK